MPDSDRDKLVLHEMSSRGSAENTSGNQDTDEELLQANGINVWQTAVSLAGGMAGLGFLAIVVLVVSTGWIGFILFSFVCSAMIYTAILLGRCWNMVRLKWDQERHPYGAVGEEAFGVWARRFINFLVALVCFTNTIPVLMGFTEMTLTIGGMVLEGTLCFWPLVYGLIICPFVWLGTPKNFWLLLAASLFTCSLSMIFVTISTFLISDSISDHANATHSEFHESKLLHLSEATGTVLWVLSLHSTLLTVQQDMQQPQALTKALILANFMTLPAVLVVMLSLLTVFGNALTNVTGTAIVFSLLPDDSLKKTAALLILVHQTGVVLFVNNPLFQYLEEVLDIPKEFTWKRVILRSSIIIAQVFIQETVPHFTLLASISGGLLNPLLSLLIPCLCYLRLTKKCQSQPSKWFTLETAVCFVIIGATPCLMVFILLGTGLSIGLGRTAFTMPCYVNATRAGL
ncbi:amino acid transporter AVT1I-like [Acanthaster planci]|uniref:Amino acid transporter AVT1I-like n=1 Tax=Acanthaster planci TaxID=133434 RepID=A0A8B7YPL5_ACAPL|nr:amino acid transporter AVT1I-like [Acanthaster planci]XP_022095219.1 amino acid transporter AVT1I-like [Acanthaster planci]